MKNIYFVKSVTGEFELYVDGECITDCYNVENEDMLAILIYDLIKFAEVPLYREIPLDRKCNETSKEFLARI